MASSSHIALNLMFLKFSSFAVAGIALSSSVTSTLEMFLLFKLLNKKIKKLGMIAILNTTIKSLTSSIVMGISVFLLYSKLEMVLGAASKMNQLITVSISIIAGILIYGTASYLLKIKEFDYCYGFVKGRLHLKHS